MDVKTLLSIGYENVKNKNDVRDLLCFLMDLSFEKLILQRDEHVDLEVESRYIELIEKLASGYPLAYIKGVKDFYGREFIVSEQVLIPREETEMIIDIAKNQKWDSALDLCTGSGIIGITLELESKKNVTISDISNEALFIAQENAAKFGSKVNIVKSDLFESIHSTYDLIISNPPYIKKEDLDKLELLKSEPYIALFGGSDGLFFYDKILSEAKNYLNDNGVIIFEIGHDQMEDIVKLANKYHYRVEKEYQDIYGFDRFIKLSI